MRPRVRWRSDMVKDDGVSSLPKLRECDSRFRWGCVVDDVEGSRGEAGPAGVMDGGEGGRAVTGVWVEGDAVDGMDVGGVVVQRQRAGARGKRLCGNIGVCG